MDSPYLTSLGLGIEWTNNASYENLQCISPSLLSTMIMTIKIKRCMGTV